MARKVGIDRTAVLDAAIRTVEERGLDALTLAAVASLLGIRSPSLYAHVDGVQGLHRLLAAEAAERITVVLRVAAASATGADAIRAFADAYRGFAHEHPGLYAASQANAPRPANDPELATALAEPVALITEALGAMGVPEADHIDAVRSLRSALHGFVSLEMQAGFGLPDDIDDSFDALVETLISGLSRAPGPDPR